MEIDEGLDFGETDEEDEEQLVHITKDLSYKDINAEDEDSSCSSPVSEASDGSARLVTDDYGSDMELYTSIKTDCASRSSTNGSWQADQDPWGGTHDTTEEEKSSEEEDFNSAMIQSIEEEGPDFQ